MMKNNIFKSILSTVVYYDLLDYPLTSFEIWKYLIAGSDHSNREALSLGEVIEGLEDALLKKVVGEAKGFYFLKGRQNLVSQRLERNKISVRKLKRIRRIVWFYRSIPFIRLVAVTGRVAMKNAQAQSDLDLLIIFKYRHIFTGRLLVTLLTHLLGVRRHGKKIANRICLNYFVTTSSLEIALRDLFSSSEYSFIFPLFDMGIFKKFQQENEWISGYRENYWVDSLPNLKVYADTAPCMLVRKLGEKILGNRSIESKLKEWQTEKIMCNPKTHQEGSVIVSSDEMLVFLPEPQGPSISERFEKRMGKLTEVMG